MSRHGNARTLTRGRARSAELADLPLPRWPRPDGGYPDGPGPEVLDLIQLRQLITLGRTAGIRPDSFGHGVADDLVAVPALDAGPVTIPIAWPPHSRSRVVVV